MTNYHKYSSKEEPTKAEVEAGTDVIAEEESIIEAENETRKVIEEAKDTSAFGIVTAPLLNFRSTPKTIGDIITTIPFQTKVKIIKEVDGSDWYKIEYNGKKGFVMKTYVEKM